MTNPEYRVSELRKEIRTAQRVQNGIAFRVVRYILFTPLGNAIKAPADGTIPETGYFLCIAAE